VDAPTRVPVCKEGPGAGWGPLPTCPSPVCLPPFQNENLELSRNAAPGKPIPQNPQCPQTDGVRLLSPRTKKMAVGLRATLHCSGMLSQSQTREYGLISEVKRELAAWKESLGRGVFLLGGHRPLAGLGEAVCVQNLLAFAPSQPALPRRTPSLIRRQGPWGRGVCPPQPQALQCQGRSPLSRPVGRHLPSCSFSAFFLRFYF